MARIIAVANQKGGVGKTTTAVNLAAALAVAERPTLVVDMDPQSNATSALGIYLNKEDSSLYDVLAGRVRTEDLIHHDGLESLDVLPSSRHLIGAEIELIDMDERESVLARALDPVRGLYDFVLVDCPPSLGLLTLNSLTAADAVLVPVQCEYLAMEGLGALLDTIDRIQGNYNPELEIEGIVLTMHESRLNLTKQVEAEIRGHFGSKVFTTVISRNVRLSEAPSHGLPALLYDARSKGARQYLDLASEILERQKAREREA
jgi:chromosome partitioning protein